MKSGSTLNHAAAMKCPTCGEDVSFSPITTYALDDAAEHFCPKARNEDLHIKMRRHIKSLWGQEESYFLICEKCTFGFAYPFVGGDEAFYDLMHASAGYPQWRWDYGYALQKIISSGDGTKVVLDVGAGSGVFLKKLPANSVAFATEGGEETRKLLRQAKVKVLYSEELNQPAYQGHFDFITLFQVLEHISDFYPLLEQLHRGLKLGGTLIITVPLQDAMIDQEKYTGCLDMAPNHVNKWTPESLSFALRKVGFEIEDVQREPFSPKLANIRGILQMTIAAAARKEKFPALQAYGIKKRSLRILAMGIISVGYFFKVLPALKSLLNGRSFVIVGKKLQ